MTQKDKIIDFARGKEKFTTKQVAMEFDFPQPSVRRVLGQAAKKGEFERLAPGIYRLSIDGNNMVFLHNKDSVQYLPQLAKEGLKADMVFLDIPYDTPAIRGGNRGVNYNLISVADFNHIVEATKMVCRTIHTPVIHMFSNAKSGLEKMLEYNNVFLDYGFQLIGKGHYKKFGKNGKPCVNVLGKEMEPEGILVFNQSGETNLDLTNLEFNLERPPIRESYQTEKPWAMMERMIRSTTIEGELILDPFAGSGITGNVALRLNRKSVLIEKDEQACDNIVKTIQKTARAFH